jgi:hypothetical protein
MKIQKIAALCKRKKNIGFMKTESGIYVGDGVGFYRWEITPSVNECLL